MTKPDIIFEHQDFIAVNKPSGMLSIPDRMQSQPSLKDLLLDLYGEIFTVHRLDRETSGIIIFARNEAAHKHLSGLFEHRQTEKHYAGFVLGVPFQPTGTINAPLIEHPVKKGLMTTAAKGKEAVTIYEVLEPFGLYAYVQFTILTGRTHQIRVHMKHVGHPLVCDELYGDGKPVMLSAIKKRFRLSKDEETERPILSRLALHAHRLSFTGANGTPYQLEAPLPKDMKALLQQLQKWKG